MLCLNECSWVLKFFPQNKIFLFSEENVSGACTCKPREHACVVDATFNGFRHIDASAILEWLT